MPQFFSAGCRRIRTQNHKYIMNLIPLDVKNYICSFLKLDDISKYSIVDKEIDFDKYKQAAARKTMKKYMRNAKQKLNVLYSQEWDKQIFERMLMFKKYTIGTYLEDFSLDKTTCVSQLMSLEHQFSRDRFIVECSRHGDILKHFIIRGKNIKHIKLRYANFQEKYECIVWSSSYNNASLIHLQPFHSGIIVFASFYNFFLDIVADEIYSVKCKYLYLEHVDRRAILNMVFAETLKIHYFSPEPTKNYLTSSDPTCDIVCHRHTLHYRPLHTISCVHLPQ